MCRHHLAPSHHGIQCVTPPLRSDLLEGEDTAIRVDGFSRQQPKGYI